MSRGRLVGITAAIAAMVVSIEKMHKATNSFSSSLIKISDKPNKAKKQKANKQSKNKAKSFTSKLNVKPNSVRKDFNSRKR